MKHFIKISLLLSMLLLLPSCNGSTSNVNNNGVNNAPINNNSVNPENNSESQTEPTEDSSSEKPADITDENSDSLPGDNTETNPENNGKAKILVAYFSCTGNTKAIAEKAAKSLGDDYEVTLFEIEAKEPYSTADLDYNNNSSRANQEQNNGQTRPEIAKDLNGLENYQAVLLGYPIWWSRAPRVILTFLEKYDFSGKKIAPFCTSGSSPISGSISELGTSATNSQILEGKRFESGANETSVGDWFKNLLK